MRGEEKEFVVIRHSLVQGGNVAKPLVLFRLLKYVVFNILSRKTIYSVGK